LGRIPESAEFVYSTLINLCEGKDEERKREFSFGRLMGFIHQDGYLERTITIAKMYLADRNAEIRGHAVRTVTHFFQLRSDLADKGDLLTLASMSLKDPDAKVRETAASGLRVFAEKHPDRAGDLLPNKRLIDITARLQAIAAG
jgi:hypothetical protein